MAFVLSLKDFVTTGVLKIHKKMIISRVQIFKKFSGQRHLCFTTLQLRAWSRLTLLSKCTTSNFYRNPCDHRFAQFAQQKTAWLESDFCVSCTSCPFKGSYHCFWFSVRCCRRVRKLFLYHCMLIWWYFHSRTSFFILQCLWLSTSCARCLSLLSSQVSLK